MVVGEILNRIALYIAFTFIVYGHWISGHVDEGSFWIAFMVMGIYRLLEKGK